MIFMQSHSKKVLHVAIDVHATESLSHYCARATQGMVLGNSKMEFVFRLRTGQIVHPDSSLLDLLSKLRKRSAQSLEGVPLGALTRFVLVVEIRCNGG